MAATTDTAGAAIALLALPVKSMRGEELNAREVTERGLLGDHAFALVDTSGDKVASAKNRRQWARLFEFSAAHAPPPRAGATPSGARAMTGLRWLAAFLICLWASPIAAQDLSAAKRIVEMFLGRVGAREYEAAMKIAGDSAAFRLLPKSGVEELVTEGITAMGHREEVAHGSALFEERIYSDTWGYIKYWMKFAEEPVVWTFTMYKPEDEWYITNINITDQLEDFFKRPGE